MAKYAIVGQTLKLSVKKDQDQDPLDIYEQYAQIPSQPLMFGKTW